MLQIRDARLRVRLGSSDHLEAPAGPEASSFPSRGFATMRSTLLLLCTDPGIVADVARSARDAGYLCEPGRHHENGIDALTRVEATTALVHVGHEAATATTFAGLAKHLGVTVYLFTNRNGSAEECALAHRVVLQSTFPLLEYEGDARELVRALQARMQA